MNKDIYLQIPQEECYQAHLVVLGNSEQSWEEAKEFSEKEKYGKAISFQLISIEELIKSLMLLFDSHGFKLRSVNGMEKFFTNHQIRFVLAYFMFVIGIFGEDVTMVLSKFKEDPKELFKRVSRFFKGDPEMSQIVKRHLFRRFLQIEKELEWFTNLDLFRQDGFYATYDPKTKSSIIISKVEYKAFSEKIQHVRNVGKLLIESFTPENEKFSENLELMFSEINDSNFYDHLEVALSKVKKSKDPARNIRDYFDKTNS